MAGDKTLKQPLLAGAGAGAGGNIVPAEVETEEESNARERVIVGMVRVVVACVAVCVPWTGHAVAASLPSLLRVRCRCTACPGFVVS
jgi:hypothetical protein